MESRTINREPHEVGPVVGSKPFECGQSSLLDKKPFADCRLELGQAMAVAFEVHLPITTGDHSQSFSENQAASTGPLVNGSSNAQTTWSLLRSNSTTPEPYFPSCSSESI